MEHNLAEDKKTLIEEAFLHAALATFGVDLDKLREEKPVFSEDGKLFSGPSYLQP